MKILKIMLIILVLGGLAVPLLSCGFESDEAESAENQVVTVQRGNLTIDITAAGNLALSRTADLAFEISGTVEEVLVEEGDTVTEGQLLARLDASEWEDNVAALEDKVTAAERQLRTKERSLTTAERQLAVKERAVMAAEHQLEIKIRNVTAEGRDVLQAEVNLKNAEIALGQAQESYTWPELEVAQADVDEARANLEYAHAGLAGAATSADITAWSALVNRFSTTLNAAESSLNAMLTGADPDEVEIKETLVEISRGKLEEARQIVDDAVIAVEDARQGIEGTRIVVEDAKEDIKDAQLAVEDARKDVKDAREALDEALNTSLEIIASFAGFITTVNVDGGDEVKKGTVAVQLADPNKFEADIMVSEMDILQVKWGGMAWVQVDAMQGMNLPARVAHIAPTATIQSGVVNYRVKVEIESIEVAPQERQETRQRMEQELSSGELPERLKQAIEEGRITREQVEEVMKQRQQGPGGQQGHITAMIPEDFQLREGLTVTVSILVDERNDVLLVPNRAITRQEMETYVQVMKDGVTEERAIKTGISNWQYTEVTEGLSEGEQVIVPQGTSTATASQQRPQGGMFIQGIGRTH